MIFMLATLCRVLLDKLKVLRSSSLGRVLEVEGCSLLGPSDRSDSGLHRGMRSSLITQKYLLLLSSYPPILPPTPWVLQESRVTKNYGKI